jgi:hypothetical protein
MAQLLPSTDLKIKELEMAGKYNNVNLVKGILSYTVPSQTLSTLCPHTFGRYTPVDNRNQYSCPVTTPASASTAASLRQFLGHASATSTQSVAEHSEMATHENEDGSRMSVGHVQTGREYSTDRNECTGMKRKRIGPGEVMGMENPPDVVTESPADSGERGGGRDEVSPPGICLPGVTEPGEVRPVRGEITRDCVGKTTRNALKHCVGSIPRNPGDIICEDLMLLHRDSM